MTLLPAGKQVRQRQSAIYRSPYANAVGAIQWKDIICVAARTATKTDIALDTAVTKQNLYLIVCMTAFVRADPHNDIVALMSAVFSSVMICQQIGPNVYYPRPNCGIIVYVGLIETIESSRTE